MSEKIEDKIEKSEDKKDIEMEEREKMLNAENKAQDKPGEHQEAGEEKKVEEKPKTEAKDKEGMEVKPKKIPIGGIQMPGFFTRSKSKEKCKEDDQEVEGAELIEGSNKQSKDESAPSSIQARIKLPNPFRKSKVVSEESDGESKPAEPKERKKLLDTIRLPLVSVFPRKKKDESNLENQTQAGLASMETLDDKSTDDKNTGDDMKNVALDEKKDLERQEVAEEPTWLQKLKAYKVAVGAVLLFILLLIIIIILAVNGKQVSRSQPIKNGKYVEAVTSCGLVEGLVEDSAVAYRGIPYARPPIGDLRFKYAQPLNDLKYCWNETFLAHNATDYCLQIYSNGTVSGTEDCLTLDVVTPYVRYDNPLPVVVLIGAESFIGGSPGKLRPSARYARSKDVVFVRPNFRLGALGFLSLDILSEDNYPKTSGNYGLSDILEALMWVQRNIEHFGGDRKSVTLLGHQAGATMVTALATMKNAHKYFTRAWATSGSAVYPKKTKQEAESENRSFLDIVDCRDVDCLRKLDASKLTAAVEDTWRKQQPDLPNKNENPDRKHEWLVVDGRILQEHPATVWAREEPLPVKLVLGTTAHSGASDKLLWRYKDWSEDLVERHVNESLLGDRNLSVDALSLYEKTYKGLSTMISDIRIVCPLYAIQTQMHDVVLYVVTETRGENDIADVTSDVDAILGRYEPKTTEQRRYVSAMPQLFYNYVWQGKVEKGEGLGRKVLLVGQDVLPNSTYSHCDFWIKNNIVLQFAALE